MPSPQTKANLLELAASIRRWAVDGGHTKYPGGKDNIVQVVNQGTPGACWAFLHPEAFDFEYYSDGKGNLNQILEVRILEHTELPVNEYLARHVGVTREEFFAGWCYETLPDELTSHFERLADA